MFFKRQMPVIIMITIGLLTLLSNFIIEGKSDNLDNVTRWVNDDSLLWFGIIAAFAILLGAFNLLKIHLSKILRNNKDYPYSIFLILGFCLMIFSGFFYHGVDRLGNEQYDEGEKFIDLNDNDPIFKKIYDRENDLKRKRFIEDRNLRLSKIKNIKFIQINSLEITINSLQKDNFDLIWIDGAHGYPYVCSDITNAIRLSHPQTILMCDDVWKNLKNSDSMYCSIAAFETLEEFYKAGIIETDYFSKRLSKKYLSSEKFISLSKLKI